MFIDIIFLMLMVLAVFKGYSRGFIVALFSLIAIVVGLAAAIKLSASVANYLGANASITKQWLPVLSFLIVFVAVALLVRLGASVLEKTVQLAMLGWVNRMAGIILYMLLYIVVFSVALFYVGQMKIVGPETMANSVTWPFLQPWGPMAVNTLGKLMPLFKNMFEELQRFFEHISNKVS